MEVALARSAAKGRPNPGQCTWLLKVCGSFVSSATCNPCCHKTTDSLGVSVGLAQTCHIASVAKEQLIEQM
jgi:hypothetical protein